VQAEALERLNRGALAEMRLLMFELRPDALEHARLGDLLKLAIEALVCRGEITVEQKLSRDDALPAAVCIQFYRIAQEALSNVAQHSGAGHAVVEWTVPSPQHATLRIVDDGKGFDPEVRAPGHFGLDNMRSRAAEIGAVFHLTSAPGRGTEVLVTLAGGPP
jgi:signal transduction histidine kinase